MARSQKHKRIYVDPEFAKQMKREALEKEKNMIEFTKSIVGENIEDHFKKKKRR